MQSRIPVMTFFFEPKEVTIFARKLDMEMVLSLAER
jgi:hypothetical protein